MQVTRWVRLACVLLPWAVCHHPPLLCPLRALWSFRCSEPNPPVVTAARVIRCLRGQPAASSSCRLCGRAD